MVPRFVSVVSATLMVVCVLSTVPALPQDQAENVTVAVLVMAEYGSARATMKTFLEAFFSDDGPDLDAAAACLDLTGISANLGRAKGHELAAQLKNVLDRTRFVDFDDIPDDAEGGPYVFLRELKGEVVIARIDDGRWLFTEETVRSLDALRRATEGRDVVEGVVAFDSIVTPAMWLRKQAPESLRGAIFILEGWQWIGLVAAVILGVIANRLFIFFSFGAARRVLARHLKSIDPHLLTEALKPAGILIMVLVWWVGIGVLGLPVRVLSVYADAVRVVLILAACGMAYRFVVVVADAFQKKADKSESKIDDLLVPMLRKAAKVLVAAIGIVLIADSLDQNLTGLLAGLGLGGLAFALAAQDTVSNLFGSLTVLLDRPFNVGDWVVIGDVEGTVEEVGFRSTRIRTFYDSQITLPNSNLTSAAVDNLGERTWRRWSTKLSIAYDTPPEKIDAFCEGVRELVRRHPCTRKDYYHVYLNSFGESALEVMLYIFFDTPDWGAELRERHRFAIDILRLAAEMGVEMAFPTRTLYMRSEQWQKPAAAGPDFTEESARLCEQARNQARDMTENFTK